MANVKSFEEANGNSFGDILSNKRETKKVKINTKNFCSGEKVKVSCYLLDDDKDLELVREEIFTSNEFVSYVKMSRCSTYLLKILPL